MSDANDRLTALLTRLYGSKTAAEVLPNVYTRLKAFTPRPPSNASGPTERDITLITYGDSLLREGETPLQTLNQFATNYLQNTLSIIHLLPIYPYSSDDGFSVMDYYAVRDDLGTWDDIAALHRQFRLMFDAVINHMSAQSAWFRAFLQRQPGFEQLFATAQPTDHLSTVTRPRTTPLLTPFQTADDETVYVWTTFSDDQIDLNFKSPETLLRVLDVLLFYVEHGADVIRLDAIGFLWKVPGTTSLHLPETHAVVQFYRAALDVVAPDVVLITETNVPHAENISYFGDGHNEAQLVYNFTLPPLMLYTLIAADCQKLADWINTLDTPSPRTTFFNFTASHDGIGVRPVEGILSSDELARLIERTEAVGGRVSYKNNSDGSRSPYELNVTYVDAAAGPDAPLQTQAQRFLISQAVMLSLAGMPAIYIHSLLGSRNDQAGVTRTGHNRSINRARLNADDVIEALSDLASFRAQVFNAYRHMIETRRQQPAFHPNAAQKATALNNGTVLQLIRTPENGQPLICLFNISDTTQDIVLARTLYADALRPDHKWTGPDIRLEPYDVFWLYEVQSD